LFSQFNIQRVLSCGASLLGSEGGQYDMDTSTAGEDLALELDFRVTFFCFHFREKKANIFL
jgi:hypothetical protein